jgi:ABC-type multidrug transport system fused ATPase/permease subunit
MRTLLRSVGDYRPLWWAWLPLLGLAMLVPLVGLVRPLVERYLIDDVVLPRRQELLLSALAIYAGLWALGLGFHMVAGVLRAYLDERLTVSLRQRLFAQSEALSVAFAHREHSGQTMALFFNDAPTVAGLFTTVVIGLLSIVTALVIGVVIMLNLSWPLALAAGVAPPLVAGVAGVLTRPLRPAARRVQDKAAEMTQYLQENLAGLREVVGFGQGRAQAARFGTVLDELLRLRLRVTLIDTALGAGQSLFSLATTLVILGFGGYLVIAGQTTLGTVIAMQSLFGLVFLPTSQLVGLAAGIQKALASADRVYAFLDQTPRVQERPDAQAPVAVAGAVAFEGVSFSYQPGRPVLTDLSFTAHPGELIALVGPSGAGKSTLVSLLGRFYDPTTGRVTLDGRDLRDLTLAGLRQQIAYVFQDTFLFATTIRNNIAFGRPDAGEEQIIAAARTAQAWEFIEQLPAGLATLVGERGVQLSEGQRQRLAIARAILRDPRILILDEPTAALDARSEHLLQAALDSARQGRTTIVIAHRLATVRRADRILVLDGGQLVQQGTHADLLGRPGLYRELFTLQFSQEPGVSAEQP